MADVECVLDARAELGECPVWSAHEEALYWVDIRAPALHRLHPGSGATRTWALPSRIGSFGLRDGGGAVVALVDGFHLLDFDTGALTFLTGPERVPGTRTGVADQLFFDQIVEAAVSDEGLRQAAAVNPEDKFELVFKNLLETRALHLALQRHNAELEAQLAKTAERERRLAQEHEDRRARVQQLLDNQDITMVFQPIVDLLSSRVVGVEALARFTAKPQRRPDEWFAEAAAVGLGIDLELLAVSSCVAHLDQLPADTYLSINVSPRTALDPRLTETLRSRAARVVLELTEHAPVDQYDHLLAAFEELRNAGVRIAVDDAGSGYASLQHILRLSPDIIKLDIELIRNIDTDAARQSLAAALVLFGDKIGATITAEGIETDEELHTLRRLHVPYGQGYYLGRPDHLPQRILCAQQSESCPASVSR